jgi:D-alanine-D-alanine ligase-like ATP-grasp enzyme
MASVDPAFDRSAVAAWHDDINSGCLFNAARVRGVPAALVSFSPRPSAVPQQWLRLKIGWRRYMYREAVMYVADGPFMWRTRHINRKAPLITSSKHRTSALLRAAGMSVPEGRVFQGNEVDAALDYFRSLGREVCLKPDRGFAGDGIVPRVADPAHFRSVFMRIAERHKRIFVEENVFGQVIRYIVIDNKIAAVRLDRPASVVGDGIRTIAELVDARNAETRAANLPNWAEIVLDEEVDRILALDGLSLPMRLPAGQRAFLRATSNVPTGADGIANPPGLHPSYAEATLKAVAAIPNLVLTAIDVMIADYRQPATATNHWFLDLNSAPGIANSHFIREGEPADVAGQIMDWLLAGGPR